MKNDTYLVCSVLQIFTNNKDMETKKTVRVILIFIIATLVVFSLILFFNNHLEEKGQSLTPVENSLEIAGGHQSYVAVNMPIINDDDCLSEEMHETN